MKNSDIVYIDRLSGRYEIEKVYGQRALELVYGVHWLSQFIRPAILPLLVKWPFFSSFYGWLQKKPRSKRKILRFVEEFVVDSSEFLEPISSYQSFNEFFIRRLKPTARPIAPGNQTAVIPADGRYYFFNNIEETDGFIVKGQKFNLETLLGDSQLAYEYTGASLMKARLCPSDYHRFHFPCACLPGETSFINGWLYSVNPVALRRDIEIFTKNKRTLCRLQTKAFGDVLYLEIGATNVGSIQQTYSPFVEQLKGAEKGYFEFGASSLLILFKKGMIQFDSDLLQATEKGVEIRCLMGQQMGASLLKVKK